MSLKALWQSTVGKKVVMSVTGIALMLFLIVHLAGNLTLFIPDGGKVFNNYAYTLKSLVPFIYFIEAGLLAVFVFHIVAAFQVHLSKKRARAGSYATVASKGGPSKMSVASRSMIITGIVLLIFIPGHIWLFKFNAGAPLPTVEVDGKEIKNVYEIVVSSFMKPQIAFWYTAVMLFLGFHLRHGFWSALQSLGAMNPRFTPVIYMAGLVFAILLAGGFLVIPLYFFFFGETLLAGGGS